MIDYYGEKPYISVIMPVFNSEKYLERAILSILNQSFKNFEFLIINDGSTDQSDREISNFLSDKRIVYISRENRGISYSLNEGIRLARGKYIARMDSDDFSYPERLKIQKDFLDSNRNIGICGTYIKIYGKKFNKIKRYPKTNQDIISTIFFECPFAHPTVMWNRELFLKNNFYYNETFKAEDYDLWTRMIGKIGMANIPVVGLEYTMNKSGLSEKNFKEISEDNLIIQKRILSLYGIDAEQWQGSHWFCENRHLELLDIQEEILRELYAKLPDTNEKKVAFKKYFTELYMSYFGTNYENISNRIRTKDIKEMIQDKTINRYILYRLLKKEIMKKR